MTQSSGTLEKAKFSHIVITFIASIIITAQSSINSELNTYTENPLITALINFTTGLMVLSVMMIFSRPIRQGFISIPRLVREGNLSAGSCLAVYRVHSLWPAKAAWCKLLVLQSSLWQQLLVKLRQPCW
jgi:uncharacterized membrane protein YdcZ (DUF606 family)